MEQGHKNGSPTGIRTQICSLEENRPFQLDDGTVEPRIGFEPIAFSLGPRRSIRMS